MFCFFVVIIYGIPGHTETAARESNLEQENFFLSPASGDGLFSPHRGRQFLYIRVTRLEIHRRIQHLLPLIYLKGWTLQIFLSTLRRFGRAPE